MSKLERCAREFGDHPILLKRQRYAQLFSIIIWQKSLPRLKLCKCYSSVRIKHLGEWKFLTPLQILHTVRHSEGMHRNALVKGCSTPVAMVTMAACSRPGASFSYKKYRKRSVKCLFVYLKLHATLQIGTSTIHSDIIHLHFDTFNFPLEGMWIHQYIIYFSTVSVIFVR